MNRNDFKVDQKFRFSIPDYDNLRYDGEDFIVKKVFEDYIIAENNDGDGVVIYFDVLNKKENKIEIK